MSNFSRPIELTTPSRQRTIKKFDGKGGYSFVTMQRSIIKANKNDAVDIFADEQNLFHVLLRKKEHDPIKKEYYNMDSVQSFSPVDFAQMISGNFMKLYDSVEILHDPTAVKKFDPATFYEAFEEKDNVTASFEMQMAQAKGVLAEKAEALKSQQSSTPAADSTAAEKQIEDEKALKKVRAEYKKLYSADADPNASEEELRELIAMKTGTN